jgi:hypothetical protein
MAGTRRRNTPWTMAVAAILALSGFGAFISQGVYLCRPLNDTWVNSGWYVSPALLRMLAVADRLCGRSEPGQPKDR